MFERRRQKLLPRREFYRRLARSFACGIGLILISLVVGTAGYHSLENLPWIDSYLNASMILSGMGPVTELHHPGAKIFAGIYAIYSGIALISTVAVVFAPLVHRLIHRFHLENEKDEDRD